MDKDHKVNIKKTGLSHTQPDKIESSHQHIVSLFNEDSTQETIKHLKKLKSIHNGSYGPDIDRAIKAIESECMIREAVNCYNPYYAGECVEEIERILEGNNEKEDTEV